MVMPLLTQLFIDVYGWRGALLLIGGLNFHLIVCGALLQATTAVERNDVSEIPQTDRKHIDTNLGLNLLKSMEFVSLMSVAIGSGYTIIGWTMYIVPHALDVGFEPYDAALLATVGGIGYVVGTVIFPFMSTLLSNEQLLCGSTVFTTISLLIDPISAVFYSYVGMMTSCVIFGVCRSIVFVILFKIVHTDIDEGEQTVTVAWLFFGYSIGTLSSAFLSGNIFSLKIGSGMNLMETQRIFMLFFFPKKYTIIS